uniref:Uncharacterized protein n=1 Tax=Ciona intestinalis TaxID=7719 RepID=H2Y0W7_CIOIN
MEFQNSFFSLAIVVTTGQAYNVNRNFLFKQCKYGWCKEETFVIWMTNYQQCVVTCRQTEKWQLTLSS